MIVLASASPRRRELLSRITTDFVVEPADVDEHLESADPDVVVSELSVRKAAAVARKRPRDLVIGCDTIVYADGWILGKPRDLEDAARMMRILSGREHEVYTGVAMIRGARRRYERDKTKVLFTPIDDGELAHYLATGNVLDKAGAYAIQGEASCFIRGIVGSPSGVMGLPVEIVYHMLREFGALRTGKGR